MESYRETERTSLTQGSSIALPPQHQLTRSSPGTQPRFLPAAPTSSRLSLLSALRKAHTELITPPPIVANDPVRLARWSPRLREHIDWDSVASEESLEAPAMGVEKREKKEKKVRRNKAKDVYVERKKRPVPGEVVVEPEPEPEPEPIEEKHVELEGDEAFPFLTVGLIGKFHLAGDPLSRSVLSNDLRRSTERRQVKVSRILAVDSPPKLTSARVSVYSTPCSERRSCEPLGLLERRRLSRSVPPLPSSRSLQLKRHADDLLEPPSPTLRLPRTRLPFLRRDGAPSPQRDPPDPECRASPLLYRSAHATRKDPEAQAPRRGRLCARGGGAEMDC